jgi:hypothetical protein
MLPRLGKQLWDTFVTHAKQHYWQAYRSVFTPPSLVLECSGTVDGTPCPHALRIDLGAPDAHCMSGLLHLDHERKVHEICRVWLENLPQSRARGMMAVAAKTFATLCLVCGTGWALDASGSDAAHDACAVSGYRTLRIPYVTH